jgi:hypothetical protein
MKKPDRSFYTLDLQKALAEKAPERHFTSLSIHPNAKRDVKNYFAIHESPPSVGRFFKKIFHFLSWTIRLFVPDFLVGHPNLFDNLYALRKNPQFRPLRMLLVSWMIVLVVFSTAGLYAFVVAPPARAQTSFSIQTGYYLGTGLPLTISGLGFAPQMVIIKSDTAAGAMVWKSSAMPTSDYAYFIANADNVENNITLTSTGFSLGVAADVNSINVRYTYIAFSGSNCSATGNMCIGSYVGNGAASQAITVGFTPDLIWTKRPTALAGNFRTSVMPGNNDALFTAAASDTTGLIASSTNGFSVNGTNNTNGAVYYYAAFKDTVNNLTVGTYAGNATDPTTITTGFQPNFVLVKSVLAAGTPTFNITQTWGNYSSFSTLAANASGNIESLTSSGFTVSAGANVNALGDTLYYFAFGGAPAPTFNGTYSMTKGSYTGNGTAQGITLPFVPDLIIIKGNAAQFAVFSTSMNNNLTFYFGNSAVGFASGITAMGSTTTFYLGSNATVNGNGTTYEYTAFGNATSPQNGPQASDFVIGTYTGNGLASRSISGLGITPALAVVDRTITTAELANWQSSSMLTNTAAYFSANATDTTGTIFNTLNSDGFTVGTSVDTNASGGSYVFFGFKDDSLFSVGSYIGNGAATSSITGVGFQPDLVWVKAATAQGGALRSSDPSITGTNSQLFLATANTTAMITSFLSNGFTVGNAAQTGTNNIPYFYAAWQATTSQTPPATPSASAPANAATHQVLTPTLSASAFSSGSGATQAAADWQISTTSGNYTSSVYDSGATTTALTSIGIPAGILTNGTTYYWHVEYKDSNGVWSGYSGDSSFTVAATPATPTNVSPSNGALGQNTAVSLSALPFSDTDSGASQQASQWLVRTASDPTYSSPVLNSGTDTSDLNSIAVSGTTLSANTTYFWKVRYEDDLGNWSAYSPETVFSTGISPITILPLGAGEYTPSEPVRLSVEVENGTNAPINNATTVINIYDPSNSQLVTNGAMSYLSGSNGIYYYSYTVPATTGTYIYSVTATDSNNNSATSSYTFDASSALNAISTINTNVSTIGTQVTNASSTLANQITSVGSQVTTVSTGVNTVQTSLNTVGTNVTNVGTQLTNASSSLGTAITSVATNVATANQNLDILLGALIVTQSSVNDPSPTATSFISALTNSTDNFYQDAVLTFTSGTLKGESRRVASYSGSSATLTLDPALTSAPANGDTFTIVTQDVHVQSQVAAVATTANTIASTSNDTNTKVTNIQATVNSINNTLQTVNTNLDSLQSTVSAIRTSQQALYTANLTSPTTVATGDSYKTSLNISSYQSTSVDASSTPTVTLYDPSGTTIVSAASMTHSATGQYTYNYSIPSDATTGLWETVATIPLGAGTQIQTNYWQVTGSPTQVIINSMASLNVPNISANVTITNEGSAAYEYSYEYCVVANQSTPCGNPSDTADASASKLIQPSQSFTPTLTLTVPNAGNYYFKVVVTYNTQQSAASLSFAAISGTSGGNSGGSSSGGSGTLVASGGSSSNPYNPNTMLDQIEQNSAQLQKVLTLLGNVDPSSPGFQSLLQVNQQNTASIKNVQNTLAGLAAVSNTIQNIVSNGSSTPIIQTYMGFNSVELNFLITNPEPTTQTLAFKAFLPAEVKPEDIIQDDGLTVDYDPNAQAYFVSANLTVAGGQSVTKTVEVKDIWLFDPNQIATLQSQAQSYNTLLAKTALAAQSTLLTGAITTNLSTILQTQSASYDTPQNHIVVYRNNLGLYNQVTDDMSQLKNLVAQSGASASLLGSIGGIQTFAVWGIILAMVVGFGLLAAVIFTMWKHQMLLTAMAMGVEKSRIHSVFPATAKPTGNVLNLR